MHSFVVFIDILLHNPQTIANPQVDIMQMCVVEMTDRPEKPLFHLEHYIEGKYIKYNSNSGFVRDDNIRLTPQVSKTSPFSTDSRSSDRPI